MRKHWAVWLVVIHVVVTSVFVIKQRVDDWRLFEMLGPSAGLVADQAVQSPRWWKALQRWWHPPPPITGLSFDLVDIDIWPSAEEKAYRFFELPVNLLVGWYMHPAADRDYSLFPIGFFPGVRHISYKARIVVLDTLMIALVGLHWWLVGRLLKRHDRLARWVKIPVVAVTSVGVVWAIVFLLPKWEWIRIPVGLTTTPTIILAWLWIFGASVTLIVRAGWMGLQRRFAGTN